MIIYEAPPKSTALLKTTASSTKPRNSAQNTSSGHGHSKCKRCQRKGVDPSSEEGKKLQGRGRRFQLNEVKAKGPAARDRESAGAAQSHLGDGLLAHGQGGGIQIAPRGKMRKCECKPRVQVHAGSDCRARGRS